MVRLRSSTSFLKRSLIAIIVIVVALSSIKLSSVKIEVTIDRGRILEEVVGDNSNNNNNNGKAEIDQKKNDGAGTGERRMIQLPAGHFNKGGGGVVRFYSTEMELYEYSSNSNNKSSSYSSTSSSTTSTTTEEEEFCVPWSVNTDKWWTHHPTWEVFFETDSYYCFHLISDLKKREFFHKLYTQQFKGDCNNAIYLKTSQAGWGASTDWYGSGLRHGVATNRPFQLVQFPWYYAAPHDARNKQKNKGRVLPGMEAVCPQKDMTCYFLPLSNCPMLDPKNYTDDRREVKYTKNDITEPGRWYYDYIVRPRTWLRHKIYNVTSQQTITKPCMAMHVRRGDTILIPGERSYHAIAEYLQAANIIDSTKTTTSSSSSSSMLLEPAQEEKNTNTNIFLMTDDANAIREAVQEFPPNTTTTSSSSSSSSINWMYLDRPRFAGNSGGWESHLPSNDAASEVVYILSEFQLAQQCSSLVHGRSTFANLIQGYMKSVNSSVVIYKITETKNDQNNAKSLNISTSYGTSAAGTTKTVS